jgi:hypothetical protein
MGASEPAKKSVPKRRRSALAAIAENVGGLILLAGLGAVIYFYVWPWTQTTAWPWARSLFDRPVEKPAEGVLLIKATRRTALPADYRVYVDGKIVGGEEWPGGYLSAPTSLEAPGEAILWVGTERVGTRNGKEWLLDAKPEPTVKEYRLSLKPGTYEVQVAVPNHHVGGETKNLGPDVQFRWDDHGNVVIPQRFPYSFRQETLKVEKDKTTVWEIDVDGRCFSGQFVARVPLEASFQWGISYVEAMDRVHRGELTLPHDLEKVLSALMAAHEHIRASAPKRPVLRLPVPGLNFVEREGFREFDIGQIKQIKHWLLRHYVDLPEPKQIFLAAPMYVPEIGLPEQIAQARVLNKEIRAKYEADTAAPLAKNAAESRAHVEFKNLSAARPLVAPVQERERISRLLDELVEELSRVAR